QVGMSNAWLHGLVIELLSEPQPMSSHPTPPGPFLHRGTIDSYAPAVSAFAISRPTSGQSWPMRSGLLLPSHVVTGIEKVTGSAPQPSAAEQTLRSAPAIAVAVALAVHVFMPRTPARNVLKVLAPPVWTPPALVGMGPPRPTVPTML